MSPTAAIPRTCTFSVLSFPIEPVEDITYEKGRNLHCTPNMNFLSKPFICLSY